MLKNFRRQIDEAGISKHKYGKKESSQSNEKAKLTLRLKSKMPLFENKFYHIPVKT
jgi:hypothetical protein